MTYRRLIVLTLLISLAAASPADQAAIYEAIAHRDAREAAGAPLISQDDYARALDGDVVARITRVDGVPAAKAWGLMVLDHPVETVWTVVNSETRMAGELPVSEAHVLSGQSGAAPRQVFEFLPLPLLADRWWVVDVTHNAALYDATDGRVWEQVWTDATHTTAQAMLPPSSADGIPVAWTQGAWLLVSLPNDRTLLEYYVWTDPGGSIPAGPATRFAAGAVRDTLRAVDTLCGEAAGWPEGTVLRPNGTAL